MTVRQQAQIFVSMALYGAALGGAYDVLALARRLLHAGRAVRDCLDLMLGAACAAGMIAVGLALQAEVFRWYAFAGVLLGLVLYGCTVGTIVRKIAHTFGEMSKKVKK